MRIVIEYARSNGRPIVSLWRNGILMQYAICLSEGVAFGLAQLLHMKRSLMETYALEDLDQIPQDEELFTEYLEDVHG